MINIEDFLSQKIEKPLATRLTPIPDGDWLGQITDLDLNTKVIKSGDRVGQEALVLDVWINFTDPQLSDILKRQKITMSYSIFLDLTENGKLDMSEDCNTKLGRLLEVTDTNKKGSTIQQLINKTARFRVRQEAGPDGEIYSRIKTVTHA